ncbi:hypothetical protein [Microcoleus sp.]|uniref:hypothetical protein n=1 Tax=Microcoleus sp. TaxID=44472 RepID=UPI003525E8E4
MTKKPGFCDHPCILTPDLGKKPGFSTPDDPTFLTPLGAIDRLLLDHRHADQSPHVLWVLNYLNYHSRW